MIPEQAHAVLAASEALLLARPGDCLRLVRGTIRASRLLHGDYQQFLQAVQRWLSVELREEEWAQLWLHLARSGFFAVNGAGSRRHWGPRLEQVSLLYGEGGIFALGYTPAYDSLIASNFIMQALGKLGRHPSDLDQL
ncbi:unnamed protein product [Polarella glacialis]|uniref:Uncharacterized protein n=1 Tax=Polarella glacialis TaxID=89957 RepID=A0A813FMF9_POLGL|nr:unnamed protein product [Polarella glacialis]